MTWIFHVLICVLAVALLGAGFMYPFNPKQTVTMLKKVGVVLVALLFAPAILSRFLNAADPIGTFVALMIVCALAYFIRESRMHKRPVARRPGPAERRPIVPQIVPESEEEPDGENGRGDVQ